MGAVVLGSFVLIAIAIPTNSLSIIPPPPGDQCVGPHGEKGLGPAIRELVDLLPAVELLKIYIYAVSNDREVENVMKYLEGPEFRKIVVTMHNTAEFSDVMEYICEELFFDAYFYLNSLGGLFNFPPMTRPPHHYHSKRDLTQQEKFYRPGFQGFLEDLRDAIPIQKLKETYRKRLAEDEYLQLAMEKIGSEEFRKIGDAIEALPEYQNLLQKLREIGVDIDRILKAIMDFFGWEVRPPKLQENKYK